ncbi:MAG: tetratricopeptide repeat protein [Nocardioidaceae bacterium]
MTARPDSPHDVEARIIELWDFDDPRASYDTFVRVGEEAGRDTTTGLAYLTQAGRALGLVSDFEAAAATLADVQQALPTIGDEQCAHHVRARLAIEQGRVLNSSGSPEQALPLFQQAYDEATAARTTGLAVDALHMSAIAAGQLDCPEAAASLNQRAMEIAETSDDPLARRWLGSLLNNHGWDRHDAGAYDEALSLLERAVEVRLEQGSPQEIAVARWCVGRCLRSLERYAEALEIQETLASATAATDDGYVFEELGECLLALGRPDEAAPYFSRAHELLSRDDWLADNETERLQRLAMLAE